MRTAQRVRSKQAEETAPYPSHLVFLNDGPARRPIARHGSPLVVRTLSGVIGSYFALPAIPFPRPMVLVYAGFEGLISAVLLVSRPSQAATMLAVSRQFGSKRTL